MPDYMLEHLGPASRGNLIMSVHRVRHPQTGNPVMVLSMSRGGFVVVDPHTGDTQAVRSETPIDTGWALAQGPDGDLWYTGAGYGPQSLCRWDWTGEGDDVVAREAAVKPRPWTFTIGVGTDGCVYLPECVDNVIHRFDPTTGKFEVVVDAAPFGKRARNIACANDGWVYCNSTTYNVGTTMFAFDVRTCEPRYLQDADGNDLGGIDLGGPLRLDDGTVVVLRKDSSAGDAPANVYAVREGRVDAQPLEPSPLCEVDMGASLIQLQASRLPLAFEGTRVERIMHDTITLVDDAVDGGDTPSHRTVRFPWENKPLRQFSITSGEGRIWLGTFIPLTLNSYDPVTGLAHHLGNPTGTNGEIYNMTFARGRLFMGSYTQAALTVYDPKLPWSITGSAADNPRQLGLMKEQGLPLHRPHGIAKDGDDNVFFAAVGDYGCEDSGICRIDPDTLDVTRWLYRDTRFHALAYLSGHDLLLVNENRKHETMTRFTFISPRDGSEVWSGHVIPDASIHSWLHVGGDIVVGMHASRGMLFTFNVRTKRVEKTMPEIGLGIPCYNALIEGPDGRIWGLTNQVVFAVDRELSKIEVITRYDSVGGNAYRFGMCYGPDGHLYFANNTELMRIRIPR